MYMASHCLFQLKFYKLLKIQSNGGQYNQPQQQQKPVIVSQ